MTIPVPTDGSHIVCLDCGGKGAVGQGVRAALRRNPDVHTLFSAKPCRPCEGTGWLPPKHDGEDPRFDAYDEPEGDGDDEGQQE